MIRILIADDHAVLREGMRQILEREKDLIVVAEASDGEEAVKLAGNSNPDVAIIDIAMPKIDGIEATKQIKALYPEIAILILSAYDDDQFISSFLEIGAAGYLLKNVRSCEIIDAIRAVSAGESVLHPKIARKILKHFSPSNSKSVAQQRLDSLSKREVDILKLAASGLHNEAIAKELCLSLRTIQGHLNNIFNKLHVKSRTEAVVHALKENLINLDDVP